MRGGKQPEILLLAIMVLIIVGVSAYALWMPAPGSPGAQGPPPDYPAVSNSQINGAAGSMSSVGTLPDLIFVENSLQEPGGHEHLHYQVNENGQTYGPADNASSIETLPDLIHAGSVDMTECYINTKDLLAAMPKTPEEALDFSIRISRGDNPDPFPLYKDDGKTIIGEIVFCPELLPESIRSEYATPAYPVNKYGKTYGSLAFETYFGVRPDLIPVVGTGGTKGYVYNSEMYDEPMPQTPEGALARQAKRSNEPPRSIPLYTEDGKTVIGEFEI